jgi:hypothetical protein
MPEVTVVICCYFNHFMILSCLIMGTAHIGAGGASAIVRIEVKV